MEDELVAVVQKPPAVDRFVVADGQVVGKSRARASERLLDRDRLDPVNRVLQLQMRARRLSHVKCRPWIRRLGPDVQKQRPVRRQSLRRPADPFGGPFQVAVVRERILVGPVPDAEVIWRRRDDCRYRAGRQPAEYVDAVAKVEAEGRAAGLESCMGVWVTRHRRNLTKSRIPRTKSQITTWGFGLWALGFGLWGLGFGL